MDGTGAAGAQAIDLTWREDEARLREWAEPLLDSAAFQRLREVTFLGGLSCRHGGRASLDDGSRREHSVGVAALALRAAERLGLSDRAKRLAIAWGLTHDIATWSLSHTSEPAFTVSTATDQRTLRRFIISDASAIAGEFMLTRTLRAMGVESEHLLGLLDKNATPKNREHAALWQVINSPLNPDGLEGVWRAGAATGVQVPHPHQMIDSLERGLWEPSVRSNQLRTVATFWRAKERVYREYINDDHSRWFESRWALSIRNAFRRIGLMRSLRITEPELARHAPIMRRRQLMFRWGEMRFRVAQTYVVDWEPLDEDRSMALSELRHRLRRQPVTQ